MENTIVCDCGFAYNADKYMECPQAFNHGITGTIKRGAIMNRTRLVIVILLILQAVTACKLIEARREIQAQADEMERAIELYGVDIEAVQS